MSEGLNSVGLNSVWSGSDMVEWEGREWRDGREGRKTDTSRQT